jgi:hypothetical protein
MNKVDNLILRLREVKLIDKIHLGLDDEFHKSNSFLSNEEKIKLNSMLDNIKTETDSL